MDARKPGFQQALEWAEAEVNPIDQDAIRGLNSAEAAISHRYQRCQSFQAGFRGCSLVVVFDSDQQSENS